jgi:acyl-CoA thioesterase FadM
VAAWEQRIEIRWRDVGRAGRVAESVYLTYLETVRTRWLERVLGDGSSAFDFVLARVAVDYRRGLTLADGVAVASCRIERIGRSSIGTVEEIRTADGELAAAAEAVIVAWSQADGTSRPLTDGERTRLEQASA